MFIGHFAVAYAVKKAAPRTSLATLFLSAQLLDVLWPLLILAGVEGYRVDPGNTAFTPLDFHYPFSHSLLGSAVSAVIAGGVYLLWRRSPRAALVIGVLVFSHWVLDLVVHRPDLPLAPGSDMFFGLGLWNSVVGAYAVEGTLYLAGVLYYLRNSFAQNRAGRFGSWALAAFLPVVWVANSLSPPLDDSTLLAVAALAGTGAIALWAWWTDGHRRMKQG